VIDDEIDDRANAVLRRAKNSTKSPSDPKAGLTA
jgi:hypothetical protein